jgi:F0F1-type ATP synthase assembly protein I
MADTRPTKLNFLKIIYLCFLAFFNQKQFIKEEEKDNAIREDHPVAEEKEHRIHIVIRSFWCSLGLIILSAALGILVGWFLHYNFNNPTPYIVSLLQIVGACLLLWGTLFIRGWEIQTFCGVTITERVNQWIYRTLYCMGTSIVTCSLVWIIK